MSTALSFSFQSNSFASGLNLDLSGREEEGENLNIWVAHSRTACHEADNLRVGDEDDLDQEGDEEEDLPDGVEPRLARVLYDQVSLAPVALVLVFVLKVRWHDLVVIDLEEKLHEVLVAVA